MVALLLTRLEYFPFAAWLKQGTIEFHNLFGTGISPAFEILHSPGTIFIVVSILTYWLHSMGRPACQKAIKSSVKVVVGAGAALVLAVPMVQIFLQSDGGAAGFMSMPSVLAEGFSFVSGAMWTFVAPIIGAIGAFLAGSNTFSNMMFSLFQFEVAENIGLNPSWIVALQSVGAAAGNMICVLNVVMASAAVGLTGREGEIIRKAFLPLIYYLLFAGSVVYIIMNGFDLNVGSMIAVIIVASIIVSIMINRAYHLNHLDHQIHTVP